MAGPTMAPHGVVILNRAQFILDGVAYGDATSKCRIEPTTSTQTWTPISGKAQTKNGATSYQLGVTLGQDYAQQALWRYLWEHEGQSVPFELRPDGDAGPSFKGTVTSLPVPALGGDADAVATADVVFPLAGKPAATWATAG